MQGLSLDVRDQLVVAGENIRLARRARKWSLDETAGTVIGGPKATPFQEQRVTTTAIGAYAAALDVMG